MTSKSPIPGDSLISPRNQIPLYEKVREKVQSISIRGEKSEESNESEKSSRKKKVIIPKPKNYPELNSKSSMMMDGGGSNMDFQTPLKNQIKSDIESTKLTKKPSEIPAGNEYTPETRNKFS
jgi:hypothetical protein